MGLKVKPKKNTAGNRYDRLSEKDGRHGMGDLNFVIAHPRSQAHVPRRGISTHYFSGTGTKDQKSA